MPAAQVVKSWSSPGPGFGAGEAGLGAVSGGCATRAMPADGTPRAAGASGEVLGMLHHFPGDPQRVTGLPLGREKGKIADEL